jgi:CheY-like chemotaxis protein
MVGAKVLVVEDRTLVAMEIELSLQEQGCVVLGPTATIADTLAILAHDRPDAVLLDMRLRDGLATPIAATLAAMGVPFALLTADRLDTLKDASFAGVPHIMKPWSAGALEQMVEQLLASSAAGLNETLPAAAASSQATAPT